MAPISFDGILASVDHVVAVFLKETYPHMAGSLSDVVYLTTVIYWVVLGLRIYAGHEPVRWNIILSRAVMTLAAFSVLRWGGLAGQVYGFFTTMMDGVVAMTAEQGETVAMINGLWNDVGQVAAAMMKVSSLQFGIVLQGYGLFVMNCILFAVTLVYLTMAKMGLAITMLLLPVFVSFFLFEQTRQWAMNWISVMLNFCFIYMLVFLLLRLGLAAFAGQIRETTAIADAFNDIGTPKLMKGQVQNVAYLYLIEIILILFMLQVKSWAAALSRGTFAQGRQVAGSVAQVLSGRK